MNALPLITFLLSAIAEQRNSERLLREEEAAERLGVSKATLGLWRKARRIGHIQAQDGGAVLYRAKHIEDFLLENEIRPRALNRAPRVSASNFLRREAGKQVRG